MKKGSVFGRRGLAGNNVQTPLTPTVTKDFGKPAYPGAEENGLSPQEKETRILQLTSAAKQLLKLGLSEQAFESLMRAYLLDPMSSHVIACEKAVLPAWELMHRQPSPLTPVRPISAETHLPEVKDKKEAERIEQERARWEHASSKPRILDNVEISRHPRRGKMP